VNRICALPQNVREFRRRVSSGDAFLTLDTVGGTASDVRSFAWAESLSTSGPDGQLAASGAGSGINGLVRDLRHDFASRLYPIRRCSGQPDWGGRDYELLEHVGQSQLLLDRDLQEPEVSSSREHNVRAQGPSWRDRCFLASPAIDGTFHVRCDECSEEYEYRPEEILRVEQSLPESFTPHPLFRDS